MKQVVPIFEADVVDGKPKILDHVRQAMARWFQTFRTGTHIDIIIRKHRSKRTELQNSYYWSVVVPILALHFGHDNPEDMHEDLKLEHNPIESKITPGKIIGGTTTTLSTVEFMSAEDSYVERICRWAASEHGVYIPPPEKAEKEDA